MSDLISRQAAIEAMRKCQTYRFSATEPRMIMLADAEEVIEELPSVQPERKKGKWMHDKDDVLYSGYCSCCGWESVICETDVADMPYCPNCGADMRGEGHE